MDTSDEIVICDNPIVDFLKLNVQKIRNEIGKTKETINFLSEKTDEVLNEVAVSSMGVELSTPILKLHHDKYVLWYQVKNTTNKSFQNFEFLLDWNSDSELTYLSSMHPANSTEIGINKPLTYIDKLMEKAFLVITLERPSFLESQTIEIEGFLSYSDVNGENYVDDIETIILKSVDVSNKSILSSIEEPGIMNFYTCLVSSFRYDFFLQFETDTRISAALAKASLIPCKSESEISKRCFVVRDDCFCFKGIILEITARNQLSDIYNVSVYTKDDNSLLAFSHHLHHTMKPVLFLPVEYSSAVSTNKDLKEKRKNLNECLEKEISSLLDLSKNIHESFEDYSDARKKLIDLEYETDSAYVEYVRSERDN